MGCYFFSHFGLLLSLYCKISYSLAQEHRSHKNLRFWQPTYDSVCKDNSWIHGNWIRIAIDETWNVNAHSISHIREMIWHVPYFFLRCTHQVLHTYRLSRGLEILHSYPFSYYTRMYVYMYYTYYTLNLDVVTFFSSFFLFIYWVRV